MHNDVETKPSPTAEAVAREIVDLFVSDVDNPELDVPQVAEIISRALEASAPSRLVEALEAVDDDDTGVLNTDDSKDFKLGFAAGVKQVQDEVKEILAAHKAGHAMPGGGEKS